MPVVLIAIGAIGTWLAMKTFKEFTSIQIGKCRISFTGIILLVGMVILAMLLLRKGGRWVG